MLQYPIDLRLPARRVECGVLHERCPVMLVLAPPYFAWSLRRRDHFPALPWSKVDCKAVSLAAISRVETVDAIPFIGGSHLIVHWNDAGGEKCAVFESSMSGFWERAFRYAGIPVERSSRSRSRLSRWLSNNWMLVFGLTLGLPAFAIVAYGTLTARHTDDYYFACFISLSYVALCNIAFMVLRSRMRKKYRDHQPPQSSY